MGMLNSILTLFTAVASGVSEFNASLKSDTEQLDGDHKCFGNEVIKEKCSVSDLVRRQKEQDFFAIDLETTGLSSQNDRIVEIGIVRFSGNEVIDKFNTLVNPGRPMPKQATAVNHITNRMLMSAPTEKKALQDMIAFLNRDPITEIVFCAHNADFDMGFLTNALKRHGFSLKFSYVDTCQESRRLVPRLANYKLATVAKKFRIINDRAHRATEDAQVCGLILGHLVQKHINEQATLKKQNKVEIEKTTPREEEKIVCAFVFSMLNDAKKDLSLLRFYRNSSNYIAVEYWFLLFKFKFAKKGKYILLPSCVATASGLPTEDATMTEGGAEYLRAFFNAPSDLLRIKDFVIESYDRCYKEFLADKEYSQGSSYYDNNLDAYCNFGMQLDNETANALVNAAGDVQSIFDMKMELEQSIDINPLEIEIHPVHTRVPVTQIRTINNGVAEYVGGLLWEKGDSFRKSGSFEKAIAYFDKARRNGYCSPMLYESYAMTFHKTKEYDDEIDILNEGIERLSKLNMKTGQLITRRNKVIKALIKQTECEQKQNDKAGSDQKSRACAQRKKAIKNKSGHSILQMDDTGNIIEKFETIADATKSTGINSTSIRDTAKGIQKHAGGYVWKFADDALDEK